MFSFLFIEVVRNCPIIDHKQCTMFLSLTTNAYTVSPLRATSVHQLISQSQKASLSPNELSQDRASSPIFFQIEVGFEQRPLVSQATYNIIFQSYAPLWNAHTLKSISSSFNPLANCELLSSLTYIGSFLPFSKSSL